MQKYASFSSASGPARLRIAFYYVQRVVTSRTIRHVANRLLVAVLRRFAGTEPLSYYKTSLATHLRHAGFIELGKLLGRSECADIHRYLRERNMVDTRGTKKVFRIDDVPEGVRLGDYSLETVVNCPHVLELANRPELIKLMASYLGYKPTIVDVSLRWSFPAESAGDQVQRFHRDAEPGSVKVLVYLTDVDNLSGPHAYVEGTHRERMPWRLRPYSDSEIASQYGSGVQIKGPAGTGLAIDPKGIHKGVPPSHHARLLLGIQYSLLPCPLYDYAPVQCARASQFDRYVNRLIVCDEGQPDPVSGPVTEPVAVLHE